MSQSPLQTRPLLRLCIPIGIADRRTDPPLLNRATDGLEISRPARGGSSFLVYTIGNEALEYVRFVDGRAEPPRTIDLDHDVTVERARAALDRLARSIQ